MKAETNKTPPPHRVGRPPVDEPRRPRTIRLTDAEMDVVKQVAKRYDTTQARIMMVGASILLAYPRMAKEWVEGEK